jgi:tetratricopeptide (TPR) repeat protein
MDDDGVIDHGALPAVGRKRRAQVAYVDGELRIRVSSIMSPWMVLRSTRRSSHQRCAADQRHKHERNEPKLTAALAEQPDRPFLYDHLARIYEDLGDLERARATWRAGIEVARARPTEHPDDRLLWINLLVHAVVHDDPDRDVAALLGEAQAKYPGNPAVEFAAASHEFATGDPTSAVHRLEQLVAMDEDDALATGSAYDARIFGEWSWHALGLCRFALGDHLGAIDAFRRDEAADPKNAAYRARRQLAEARARA